MSERLKEAKLLGECQGPTGAVQRLYRLKPKYHDCEYGRDRQLEYIMVSTQWILGETAGETYIFAADEMGQMIDAIPPKGDLPQQFVLKGSFQGSIDFDLALKNMGYKCEDNSAGGNYQVKDPQAHGNESPGKLIW